MKSHFTVDKRINLAHSILRGKIMFISELVGKQLLSLSEAETIGTVENVLFDEKLKTAKTLKIYSEDEDNPEICFVNFKAVKSLNFDACVISNREALSFEWNTLLGTPSPMLWSCFNQDGKELGRMRDIELDNSKVKQFLIGETFYEQKQLLSFSNSVLIFNDTGKAVRLPKTKTRIPFCACGQNISVHSVEVKPAKIEETKPDIALPNRVLPNATIVSRSPVLEKENPSNLVYRFLLGKKLSRPIKNENGNALISKDTRITEEVIELCKNNGKLVQLALYAE